MRHVAVYVTGSVAAYKAVEVVRALQKKGDVVRVAETQAATRLVGPATFASLTKAAVLTDLWSETIQGTVPHIELADWSDLAVVVPATADVIAKLANGIADDAVTTTLLATSAPIVVVPAMNVHMWASPATQRNIQTLRTDGHLVMEPASGYLAEGYSGKGRLPAVNEIVDFLDQALPIAGSLAGKHVVVTLGGTREPIDPVRYLGNCSSGKMGLAVAQAALSQGATVTMIKGSVSVALPNSPRLTIVPVETTEEMATAVKKAMTDADVLVMTAAVADFKPLLKSQSKIKKQAGQDSYQLSLTTTVDILRAAGEKKQPGQLIVGFAAETDDLLENAHDKLTKKHADMIVANDVSDNKIGFGSDENQVTILRQHQPAEQWPKMSKVALGEKLIALIAQMLGKED